MKAQSHLVGQAKYSVVFSLLWNCPNVVDDERKVGGRSFQTRGPETPKLRDPYYWLLYNCIFL